MPCCPCLQLDFGTQYFGEELERTVHLFNNGPVEGRFMIIYGTPTEIKKKLDEAEGSGGADDADDPYAGFMMAARQKVCGETEWAEQRPSGCMMHTNCGVVQARGQWSEPVPSTGRAPERVWVIV